tara:strand:+ start:66 stop:287 length:222 start_codon:yes stop_codon:yes gene_type:complete
MVTYLKDSHPDHQVIDWEFSGHPWSGRDSQGYGRKIPTDRGVIIHGRKHRVYVVCYSNAGSEYILIKNQPHYL